MVDPCGRHTFDGIEISFIRHRVGSKWFIFDKKCIQNTLFTNKKCIQNTSKINNPSQLHAEEDPLPDEGVE